MLHGFGDGLVALRFLDEVLQTVKAIRVEQPQARKVAGLAELLRGGGEQQYGRRLAGQGVDQGVLGARVVFVPDQVMGFIDHQQVPVGLQQVVLCGGVLQQKLQRHQRQLLFLEGVALCAVAAVGVEQGELQVEAAAHFHQPLVLQVLRHHDQHPANAAGLQLAVQNQARLDGLAQAYLVGQQDAGRHAVGDVARNMQLVADGLRAYAGQAQQRRALDAAKVAQAFKAQAEPGQRVDLAGKQAVAGQAKLDEVIQHGFREAGVFAIFAQTMIDQQAIGLADVADYQLPAFVVADGVARAEAHTGQRCVAQGVMAGFAAGRVQHDHHAVILRQDGAQPQFCFAVTDPALSRDKSRHATLLMVPKKRRISYPITRHPGTGGLPLPSGGGTFKLVKKYPLCAPGHYRTSKGGEPAVDIAV